MHFPDTLQILHVDDAKSALPKSVGGVLMEDVVALLHESLTSIVAREGAYLDFQVGRHEWQLAPFQTKFATDVWCGSVGDCVWHA
jgi:hypothetical protein